MVYTQYIHCLTNTSYYYLIFDHSILESSREVELKYAKQAGLLDADEYIDDDAEEEDEPEALSIHINRDQVIDRNTYIH